MEGHKMKVLIWIGCLVGSLTPAYAMTVEHVIGLSRQGAGAKEIIRKIDAKRVVFELRPADVVRLRLAGVQTAVIDHMRDSRFAYGAPVAPGGSEATFAARNRKRILAVRAAETSLSDLRGQRDSGRHLATLGAAPMVVGAFVLLLQHLNSDEYEQNYLPMGLTTAVGGVLVVTGLVMMPSDSDIEDAQIRVKDARRHHRFTQPRAHVLSAPAFRF